MTLIGGAGAAAAAVSVDQFPASIYPAAVAAAPHHALALCPSLSGLEPFDSRSTTLALKAAFAYDRASLKTDLRNSDRAWWPQVRRMWLSGRPGKAIAKMTVVGSQPAAKSGFAVFMRPACGASILAKSLMITIGPTQSGPGPHCSACNSPLFFVNRRGRPLVYFVY